MQSRDKAESVPDVSILIPAYESASFIDRTLLFARGQTHGNISIIVSVDVSTDDTADIVRSHCAADARVTLHQQGARLGWAGNVNFLLHQVETPYFFIYFHDDILLPQYTQHMLQALQGAPEAAGVYCDMGHFGASDKVSSGPAYSGSTTARLLQLMLAPERGSPLRALLRSTVAGHVRLPDLGAGGFWANEPFLMDMLAAGPLHHYPQVLYLRWSQRAGGLTDSWKDLPPGQVAHGWRANVEARLASIERAAVPEGDRRALQHALFLAVFPVVKDLCDEQGQHVFAAPADLHAEFANLGGIDRFAPFGDDIARWAAQRHAQCEV